MTLYLLVDVSALASARWATTWCFGVSQPTKMIRNTYVYRTRGRSDLVKYLNHVLIGGNAVRAKKAAGNTLNIIVRVHNVIYVCIAGTHENRAHDYAADILER